MTVGSITRGSITPVITDSGPGFIRSGAFTKTWQGGDSTTSGPVSNLPPFLFGRPSVTRAEAPGGQLTVALNPPPKPSKRRRKREEGFRFNGYECTITVVTDGLISYRYTPNGASYTGTGLNTGYGNFAFSGTLDDNDIIRLVGKLREEIAGSDFNLGVTSAEGRKTVGLMSDAATRVFNAYKAARRGNFAVAAKALRGPERGRITTKTTASNWLELQYGWLPLLNDVYNGAQYLAEYDLKRRSRRYRVKVAKAGSIDKSVPFSNVRGSCTVKGQLIAYVQEVDEVGLVGLTDPLSVAWELLPYSFVLDWFIPIGNYLSSRALASSVTGTFIQTITLKGEGSALDVSIPGLITQGINTTKKEVRVSRTVSTSLAIPLPNFKTAPEIVSLKRVLNAAGLVRVRGSYDLSAPPFVRGKP